MERGQTGWRPPRWKPCDCVQGTWDLRAPARGWPMPPAVEAPTLNHWTTGRSREVLAFKDQHSGHFRRFLFCLICLKAVAREASTSEMLMGTEEPPFPTTKIFFLIQGPGSSPAEQHRKLLENISSDISQAPQNRLGPHPPPCQQSLSKESRLPSLCTSVSTIFPSAFLGDVPGHCELNWHRDTSFIYIFIFLGTKQRNKWKSKETGLGFYFSHSCS